MKALLLAAGLGERLRPITNTIPKCLVPINDKPLLAYWLELLTNAGIKQFYINLHYHAEAVREFIRRSPFAHRVTFLQEEKLLGTGGTLKKNANKFIDGPFFLAHADNLCLTNFQAFFEAHKKRPDNVAITMMTFIPRDPRQCGVVQLDNNKIVTDFYEKVKNPPTKLANGAVFVMEPEVSLLSKSIKKKHFEISLDIIPAFRERILAWHNNDYHLDIGTPETYQKAQDDKDKIQRLYQRYKARS